jgi:hypothetical protein
VAGFCKYGDETSVSSATDLAFSYDLTYRLLIMIINIILPTNFNTFIGITYAFQPSGGHPQC